MLAATSAHADQERPMSAGTIDVEVATSDASAAATQPFADAVTRALEDRTFVVVPGTGHSRFVAQVTVSRQVRGTVSSSGPREGALAGLGGVSIPLGGKGQHVSDLVVTVLTVRIMARDSGQATWSGTATTAQAAGDVTATAAKLAAAVMAAYPSRSGAAISVP